MNKLNTGGIYKPDNDNIYCGCILNRIQNILIDDLPDNEIIKRLEELNILLKQKLEKIVKERLFEKNII